MNKHNQPLAEGMMKEVIAKHKMKGNSEIENLRLQNDELLKSLHHVVAIIEDYNFPHEDDGKIAKAKQLASAYVCPKWADHEGAINLNESGSK